MGLYDRRLGGGPCNRDERMDSFVECSLSRRVDGSGNLRLRREFGTPFDSIGSWTRVSFVAFDWLVVALQGGEPQLLAST